MGFQFLINGVDYTEYVEYKSVSISESMMARGFTLTFNVHVVGSRVGYAKPDLPYGGQLIQVYRDGNLEYGGRIGSVEQQQLGVIDDQYYTAQCIDFSIDFDMHIMQPQEMGIQLAGDIIRQIVAQVGNGFTSNNVQDGITVNQQIINYDTPTTLVQNIADSIEFHWYVGYDRDINFFYLRSRPAPIPLIDVDKDPQTYDSLQWTGDWSQVKNRLYLTNAIVKSTDVANIPYTADGQTRFYSTTMAPPFDINSVVVTVNGVAQQLLLDGITDSAGSGLTQAGVAFVCIGNEGVRFPDGSPPTSGALVNIASQYAYSPVIVVEDPVSIAAMKALENVAGAPSSGAHEFNYAVPQLRVIDFNTVYDYGQLILLRYAQVLYTAVFHTYVQGWAVGQYFTLHSDKLGIDMVLYVTAITKTIRTQYPTALFDYAITATSTPFPGQTV